jgi:hypothetical protein
MAQPSTSSSRRRQRETVGMSSTSSQRQPVIIDLTDSAPEPSVPSYPSRTAPPHREIIDLDAEPNYPPPPPISQRPTHSQGPQRITPHRHVHSLPSEDITRNNDVIILGEQSSTSRLPTFLDMIQRQLFGEQPVTYLHYHLFGQFQPPRGLNYGLNAGHVYDGGIPLRETPGMKRDDYRPPSAARIGFTRSPEEKMTLTCPQCGTELGSDSDEVKKEVWVAKCGHTYCGECALGHRRNKIKTGPKVGRCFVDGCSRVISGERAMIEVFLGE